MAEVAGLGSGMSAPRLVPASPHDNPESGNGRNGSSGVGERVASIEAHLQHLATKEDIGEVKTMIQKESKDMLRWLIGVVSLALLSITIALIRLFM